MKCFLITIFAFSSSLFAADSVTMQSTSSLTIYATTTKASSTTNSQANCQTNNGSGTITLHSSISSGDGSSESAPNKVYIPILNTSATSFNCTYFEDANSAISGAIFKPLSRGSAATTPSSSDTVNVPLRLNVGATSSYLYMAVKNGSTYVIAKVSTSTYANITNNDVTWTVSPAEICNVATSTSECSTSTGTLLEDSTSQVSSPVTVSAFFFVDDATYALGDSITASNFSGQYYSFIMSNRVYSTSVPTISSVQKGDKRVVINYDTSPVLGTSFFWKIGVLNFASGAHTNAAEPISQLTTATKLSGDYSTSQSGQAMIYGLTNSTTYNLSVYMIDLFKFTSQISTSAVGSPTEIQELLKKQSCFLLTAGFGQEHFVIDYFRKFRDQVLLESLPGKIFVHFYYKYAPKFALSIYNNEPIRAVIRGLGYFFYFVFKYFWVITSIFSLVLILMLKKKSKLLKF